jgi:hypothetical protein
MRCARNVARVGEIRNPYIIVVGEPEGKSPLENLAVDGRTLLQKFFVGLFKVRNQDSYKHSNESCIS